MSRLNKKLTPEENLYSAIVSLYSNDTSKPERYILNEKQIKDLHRVISELAERDQLVLKERFWDYKSYEDISRMMNVTSVRVRQLENKAVSHLRNNHCLEIIEEGYDSYMNKINEDEKEREEIKPSAVIDNHNKMILSNIKNIYNATTETSLFSIKLFTYTEIFVLSKFNIKTVGDLVSLIIIGDKINPDWYTDISGIGVATATHIETVMVCLGFIDNSIIE